MTVIKRLEITSFGKFRGKTVKFEPGFNELVLENEYGKSTITDFILFILYGFTKSASKKLALEDNLLQKYLPWDGEAVLCGAMELEWDGRDIRIERMQNDGRKKSVVMRDMTGAALEIHDCPGQILYGVDEETFRRTFLIRQTDMKFYGTGGIDAALKNLVTTGDEETSFDSAYNLLKNKMRLCRSTERQTGRLFDIKKRLAEIDIDMSTLRGRLDGLSELSAQYGEVCAKLSECENRQNQLNSCKEPARLADCARRVAQIRKTDEEILDTERQKSALGGAQNADIAQLSALFARRDMIKNSLSETRTELQKTTELLENNIAACPGYDEILKSEEEVRGALAQKRRINTPLAVSGILCLGAGLALMLAGFKAAGAAVLAAGLIAGCLSIILRPTARSAAGMSGGQLQTAYELFLKIRPEIEAKRAKLEALNSDLKKSEAELSDVQADCEAAREKYGVSDSSQLGAMADAKATLGRLNERLNSLTHKRQELLGKNDLQELEAIAADAGECEYTSAQLTELIAQNSTERSEYIISKQNLYSRLSDLRVSAQQLHELESEQAALSSELEAVQYQWDVLSLTMNALEEAYDSINRIYSPMLTQSAREAIACITDGKYDSVYLDRDFNIRVKSNGRMFELGYFSRGTADAVYFAIRLAVADLISQKSALPVIMDDPFWTLDDKRLELARKFAKNTGEKRQLIVFSARN